jgi:hypothetical protein
LKVKGRFECGDPGIRLFRRRRTAKLSMPAFAGTINNKKVKAR